VQSLPPPRSPLAQGESASEADAGLGGVVVRESTFRTRLAAAYSTRLSPDGELETTRENWPRVRVDTDRRQSSEMADSTES
ncbi:hypothetical protein, partial [Natrialba sp. PRR66]|uniref:hypothetical protein n=1 Tax=Natrialba sp. PRR66 TaxID=3098146 RepID=UPI002B1E81FA